MDQVIRKVEACIDYQTLYALEDDFNNIGLTIQVTSNNKVILCKLIDGKPKASKAIDDYIYIGSLEAASNEISQSATTKIVAFMRASAGKSDKIKDKARSWKDGIRMYGKAIRIGEDIETGKAISESKEYPISES